MNLYEALLKIDEITNKDTDVFEAKHYVCCMHNGNTIKIKDYEFLLKSLTEKDENRLQCLYKDMYNTKIKCVCNDILEATSDIIFLLSLRNIDVNLYRLQKVSRI